MTNKELARQLKEMIDSMEAARAERNAKVRKIFHQTNKAGWEALKKVLGYVEKRDA